jgi:hypothetical protein
MVRSGHRSGIEPNGNADWPRQNLDSTPASARFAAYAAFHGYRSAEWLTLRNAAAKLGVSHHQVRKLIKAGILNSEQIMPDAPHQIRAADPESDQVVGKEAVNTYEREKDPGSRQTQGYRTGDCHCIGWRSVLPTI